MDPQQEEEIGKCSRDNVINSKGKHLVRILQEGDWFIFNESGKGDCSGKWIYEGNRGLSVINYVVGHEEVWKRIEKLKLGDKVELDHFPLVVWVKEKGGK